MIKSCKPGMQITTSEETTPNHFVYRDALNTCLDQLDLGFYFILFYFILFYFLFILVAF